MNCEANESKCWCSNYITGRSINALTRGDGVGTALLAAVENEARKDGCRWIWLITSNDNLNALRFYQRREYRIIAVYTGAIDEARKIKPSIRLVGDHGIEIHDEIELAKSFEAVATSDRSGC